MTDRDWDREMADIDRRLAATPAATPAAPAGRGTPVVVAPTGAPLDDPRVRTVGTPAPSGRRSWRAQLSLLLRLAFGILAVAALVYWPYTARCGVELGYYLGLVGALAFAGLITATGAWRHRAAFVHVLGLVMLAAAVALGAREVLPKVGYAVPSAAHPAEWTCTAPVAPATTPAAPGTAAPALPNATAPVPTP